MHRQTDKDTDIAGGQIYRQITDQMSGTNYWWRKSDRHWMTKARQTDRQTKKRDTERLREKWMKDKK